MKAPVGDWRISESYANCVKYCSGKPWPFLPGSRLGGPVEEASVNVELEEASVLVELLLEANATPT